MSEGGKYQSCGAGQFFDPAPLQLQHFSKSCSMWALAKEHHRFFKNCFWGIKSKAKFRRTPFYTI